MDRLSKLDALLAGEQPSIASPKSMSIDNEPSPKSGRLSRLSALMGGGQPINQTPPQGPAIDMVLSRPVSAAETAEMDRITDRDAFNAMTPQRQWLSTSGYPAEFEALLAEAPSKVLVLGGEAGSMPQERNEEETFKYNYEKLDPADPLRQKVDRINSLKEAFTTAATKQQRKEMRQFKGFWDELGRNIASGSLNVASNMTDSFAAASGGDEDWQAVADWLYEKSQAKPLSQSAPAEGKWGKVKQFTGQSVGQALPYMAASMAATMATGTPLAAFGVGVGVEGGNAYREAIEAGASEEHANMNRLVVGTLNGAIEALQVSDVIKFAGEGKRSLKPLLKAAQEKSWKKILAAGKDLTYSQLELMLRESLEESLQETSSIGAQATVDPSVLDEAGKRIGMSALGGGVVGGGMGLGGAAVQTLFSENQDGIQFTQTEDGGEQYTMNNEQDAANLAETMTQKAKEEGIDVDITQQGKTVKARLRQQEAESTPNKQTQSDAAQTAPKVKKAAEAKPEGEADRESTPETYDVFDDLESGVEYKLFQHEKGPAIRTRDTDAGETVTVKVYPDIDRAKADFDKLVNDVKSRPKQRGKVEPGTKSKPLSATRKWGKGKADLIEGRKDAPLQTGQPIKIKAFHGSGRAKGESVLAEGVDDNALGEAKYYAVNREDAGNYGPNVKEEIVDLKNPYVIDSNGDLSSLIGDSPIPRSNEERIQYLRKARQELNSRGHDGVIVNAPWSQDMGAGEQSIKLVREVFGESQVVKFRDSALKPSPQKVQTEIKRDQRPPLQQKPRSELRKRAEKALIMPELRPAPENTPSVRVNSFGKEADVPLIERYKDRDIVMAGDNVAVWDKADGSLFIVALDDSKMQQGDRFINEDKNNVETAREYIDWLDKARRTNELEEQQQPQIPDKPATVRDQALQKGIAPRALEKLDKAVQDKDTDMLRQTLHPDNKNLRSVFEDEQGIKLPKGVKATNEFVDGWVGKEEAMPSLEDMNSGKYFAESNQKKIDDWIATGTRNGSRAMDTNWERGAVKRFIESELKDKLKGKLKGKWATAKIAVGKAETFTQLKAALDSLTKAPDKAAGDNIAPKEIATEKKITYTSVPDGWLGKSLQDWGQKGLRAKGNEALPAGNNTKITRKSFIWKSEMAELPVRLPRETMKAIKSRTDEVWRVDNKQGDDYWLAPKKVVEDLKAEIGEDAFKQTPKPARTKKQQINDAVLSMKVALKKGEIDEAVIGENILSLAKEHGIEEDGLPDTYKEYIQEYRKYGTESSDVAAGLQKGVEQKVRSELEREERISIQQEADTETEIGDFLDGIIETETVRPVDLFGRPELQGGASGRQQSFLDIKDYKTEQEKQRINTEQDIEGQRSFNPDPTVDDDVQGGILEQEKKTAEVDLLIPLSPNDIEYQRAYDAYRNISFDPEKRAKETQQGYIEDMKAVYELFDPLAQTEEQRQTLKDEMLRYQQNYISRMNGILDAKSRTASSMITGPARFPTARNTKRMNTEQKRVSDFLEWQKKAEQSIKKKLEAAKTPEQRSADITDKLKKEIDDKIDTMKRIEKGAPLNRTLFVNSLAGILRRSLKNGHLKEVQSAVEYMKVQEEVLKTPVFSTKNKIWKDIENAPAEIEKAEAYIRTGEDQAGAYVAPDGGEIEVVNNHDDERIRLHFEGKPDENTRSVLRSNGWKWSPKSKAWQRKNTINGIYNVDYIAKLLGWRKSTFTPDPTVATEAKGVPGFAGIAGRPGGVIDKPWLTEDKTISPDSEIEDFFGRTKKMPATFKASKLLDKIKAGLRERFIFASHLPSTPEAALARDMIRTMPEQQRAAKEKAVYDLVQILDNDGSVQALDNSGLDLLRRKVFTQDLLYEAKLDRSNAGDLTVDQLEAENGRLDSLIEQVPSVKKAYTARQALWDQVSKDLYERGVLTEESKDNHAYVRHFVLDYMENNRRPVSGKKSKLSDPYRAYKKQRKGSKRDISTDYLAVEVKALADIYADNAIEDIANEISEEYNRRKEFKKTADDRNFVQLVGGQENADRIQWLRNSIAESSESPDAKESDARAKRAAWIEELTDLDPTYEYRKRIAMHLSKINKGEDLDIDEGSSLFKRLARLAKEEPESEKGMAARGVFKAISERTKMIKESLGDKFVTAETVAEESGYVEWYYKRPNIFYQAQTLPEAKIAALVENIAEEAGDMLQISRSQIRSALVLGRRKGMLIPEWLAQQLDDLPMNKRSNMVVESFSKPFMQMWKRWILRVNPFRYNFRNQLGDIERLNASGQSAAQKQMVEAMKLLITKEGDAYHQAKDYGVIGSSLWHEMNDVSKVAEFERFKDISTQKNFQSAVKSTFTAPIKLISKIGQLEQDLTQFREDILRMSVFLHNLDKLNKGEKVRHWAGQLADIEAIARKSKTRAAAKLARETLIDYGDFTPWENDVLRNGIMPFYSFMKRNATFWPRAIKNAAKEGAAGKSLAAAGTTVGINVAAYAVRIAWLYGLAMLWNYRDDDAREKEKALPFWLRAMPHVNIGDMTIWGQTALSDFMEWADMESLASIHWRREAGFIDGKEAAIEAARKMAEAPVNKLFQSLSPYIKAPVTAATGQELYPSVFDPHFVASPASKRSLERAVIGLLGGDARKFYETAKGDRAFEDTLYAYFAGWWGKPTDPEALAEQIYKQRLWSSLKNNSKTTGRRKGQAVKGKEEQWQESIIRQNAIND